ncbi:signal recognition particle receptor subunit alpha-like [Gigantopelta aegis]|uniref:signal recognition particle receptor subunit alpha-like n=1 Tax=Gigantopelta aegis TaxID=1735272 RepID=UPI001B88D1EA|nr:signal recognition particle receptor subunit alpha-like [Gigantopelta aegis]
MLDFFSIFSKGGIVLWCFQGTSQLFTPSVNALIKSVILQERGGSNSYTHDQLTLKYKLDNEFELVFVVAYQKILQLSYIDKFLSDIQLEFRNKYKDDLQQGNVSRNYNFLDTFNSMLREAEMRSKMEAQKPRPMMTFEESKKSKKTVASMITNKKDEKKPSKTKNVSSKGKENKSPKETVPESVSPAKENTKPVTNGELDDETIMKNREKFFNRGKKTPATKSPGKSPETDKKKGKAKRVWGNAGNNKDAVELDFSGGGDADQVTKEGTPTQAELTQVGQMSGQLRDIEPESSSEENDEEEEDEEEEEEVVEAAAAPKNSTKGSSFGVFSMFKNLVGSKTLTKEDLESTLDKMKDHLVGKNVASNIAENLCQSVGAKLEGKVLGTFGSITSTVKNTLQESCVQLLSPRRRVDILRDAMEAKQQNRPYTVTFCGVNGVGKSTNLAKVCFWLVENGFSVLIAACDTFRAGAVEQLRTHTRKLNALHPPDKHDGMHMVQLYEKGYGKDAAGIAMEAVNYARDRHINVVLIDTAGRMQDNEPLMRALAKLINVNQPDLVLFVGEALVGNEAVDQLTKFNQALADHSNLTNPRLIDGIILTKFDTIDDKVGAAVSMTYTTGQPIVFVGTGQTYTDLRNLNAKAVVHALLK